MKLRFLSYMMECKDQYILAQVLYRLDIPTCMPFLIRAGIRESLFNSQTLHHTTFAQTPTQPFAASFNIEQICSNLGNG